MAAPGVLVGERRGPFPGRLDADFVRRYAEATNDTDPAVRAGTVVPPVAIVTQIWDAQVAGHAELMPAEVRATASGGVHGEHDVVLHRPIVPGEALRTWVVGHGARRAGANALLTLRYETYADDDSLVAEQWWTTVWFGAVCEPAGDAAPPHTFPDDAREHPAGDLTIPVPAEMARRYAEVSRDWSPHHFELEAARQSGFDRLFLHGLCTMALCAQAAVAAVAGGDAERVRRVAVRFASPTFLGDDLHVHLFSGSSSGPGTFPFEAEAGGAAVVRNGLVELRT
jgi:acyl dehydratase